MRSVAALTLLGRALASPILEPRAGCQSLVSNGEPAYQTSCSTMTAAVTCPKGLNKAQNGIVLLVHGTGSTGSESWQNGPYVQLLPQRAAVDVCYIDLPSRSLVDAQLSAEYVAYNIQRLAPMSATGQISVIGHSQGGGFNIQWALLYWPSTRKLVSDYIALAGDFKGTAEGPLLVAAQNLTEGANPSVIQQSVGSKYLAAQNKRGGTDLLAAAGGRTTSLYTISDDVIQPELVPAVATSNLPNAVVYTVQGVCAPAPHVADHFSMIIDPAAYNLAVDAITHPGGASVARFNKVACTYLQDNVLVDNYTATPALLRSIFADVVAVGAAPPRVHSEPLLRPYVCAAGDATGCATS